MSYDSNLTSRFSSVGEIEKLTTIKVGSKDVVEEIATIKGTPRKIHRLYAKYENGFQGVGWIIDEDINTCMICDREFGFFLRKHHCRSCGNVVCYICSPDFVVIEEMVELGEQRVCIQCYWGQYPVYASHTRTWEESDDEESKPTLEIESAFNTYRFVIFNFFEYNGDVIIEKNSTWETIIGRILNDLHILDDYAHGEGKPHQSLERLEEKLQRENIFRYCILVDEGGGEISPKIDNTKLFWQFTESYSSLSKHFFMLYLNKDKLTYLDIAKKGKLIKEDIEKTKSLPIKTIESSHKTPTPTSSSTTTSSFSSSSTTVTSTAIVPGPTSNNHPHLTIHTATSQQEEEDSDDSGSDEYDLRINTEHLKLLASKEKSTPQRSNDSIKSTHSKELSPKVIKNNDIILSFENEIKTQNNNNNDNNNGDNNGLILSLPPISSNSPIISNETFEYQTRRRSLTETSPLNRPTLVDKHRLEVENILAETKNKKLPQNTTNRRVSMTDQKRIFLSFQSTGTISTANYKKQNRRASTGMGEKKERLTTISKEDAALLALAKKSLRRQVTEEDINLLKVALPPDHLAKIHEWSISSESNIISSNVPFQDPTNLTKVIEEEETELEIGTNNISDNILEKETRQNNNDNFNENDNDNDDELILNNNLKTNDIDANNNNNNNNNSNNNNQLEEKVNNDNEKLNGNIESPSKSSPIRKVINDNVISNNQNEINNENIENNINNENSNNSTTDTINPVTPLNQPIRRKSVKYSLSKEDEELLQLARSSFQINNTLPHSNSSSSSSPSNLIPNVTDGETLRLLMTIESSRSVTLDETITPLSKKSIAEKIRKLSPADEALLMLARHSIHPIASDSTILSDYLSKTSELFSTDELKKENDFNEDDDNIDISPRNDRGSMISLKEIHRNALLDAFETICEIQQDDTSKSIDVAKDGKLSFENFLSWEQIQSVLLEGILNQELVYEEFIKSFQNKFDNNNNNNNSNNSNIDEVNNVDKNNIESSSSLSKLINFDQFCDLMERLENLAEEISAQEMNQHERIELENIDQQQSYDKEQDQELGRNDETIGIPTDIKVAYKELLSIEENNNSSNTNNSNNSIGDNNLTGITLETILQWNQLLSAINENLLTSNDVKVIFEKVYNNEQNDNNNDNNNSDNNDNNNDNRMKRMNLRQFYNVSLELQRKIDQSIGDLNELDKLTVPIMDEQMRIESLPHSSHPSRPHRRASYRETLGDNLEIYQNNNINNNNPRQLKQRNMSIHSTESFESSVQDSFDQPAFNDNEMIESELFKTTVTGHLYKQGGRVKNWKKRKFILKGCRLSYYDTKKLKGEFNTKDCEVDFLSSNECNGSEFGFVITGPGRKLLLYAQNKDDRNMWMEAIKLRIEEYERIKTWEEQINQMNKYKDDYNQRNSNEINGENNNNNDNDTPFDGDGDDDLDERDDSIWNVKHSLNSLKVDPSKYFSSDNNNNNSNNSEKEKERLLAEGKTIWHQFLDANEVLLCSGEIIKRNKFGISQKRQLILTKQQYDSSTPRLFYVDPSIMRVKGEMEWDEKKTPKAEYVNPTTFKVIVDSRTFNLTIPNTAEKTAQEWVDAINSAAS